MENFLFWFTSTDILFLKIKTLNVRCNFQLLGHHCFTMSSSSSTAINHSRLNSKSLMITFRPWFKARRVFEISDGVALEKLSQQYLEGLRRKTFIDHVIDSTRSAVFQLRDERFLTASATESSFKSASARCESEEQMTIYVYPNESDMKKLPNNYPARGTWITIRLQPYDRVGFYEKNLHTDGTFESFFTEYARNKSRKLEDFKFQYCHEELSTTEFKCLKDIEHLRDGSCVYVY